MEEQNLFLQQKSCKIVVGKIEVPQFVRGFNRRLQCFIQSERSSSLYWQLTPVPVCQVVASSILFLMSSSPGHISVVFLYILPT
mmetsp:Transcript_23935/g.35136  ORF Transcript_23935/g.35136 Transcript_23935/m.35136 type:complete len:84 (+) Transcript_23935:86-337(+)